jgi:hypothetical protein
MDLVKHVVHSLNKSNTWDSKLSEDILRLEGMSGYKTRMFYNSLCSLEFPDRMTQYLEVGAWKGSTLCSALYKNSNCHGTVIENWALFGGPKEEFKQNVEKFGLTNNITIFEEDVFSFDISKFQNKIDIYLYDGDHEEISQYKGIVHMWQLLADNAIIIVDDWNWSQVRKGTFDALRDVGANIVEKFEIMYTNDDAHTPIPFAMREFWNGIAIFVISKDT